ncbi:MAG TPA: Calx-beta domain-containing protein [Pyrinomonadaceae bacterium]|nr:Calx-beta domain-containing protein [Pyrinomonadaceae bacterium]
MKSLMLLSLLALSLLSVTAHATTITVHAGGDLQNAINSAQLGDTLILDAGATFNGPITLKANKTGSGYITIESSALASLPDANHRVSPSDVVNMPTIVAAISGQPALQTEAGASHYKLIGIEFRTVSASDSIVNLIELGSNDQTSLSQIPSDLTLDRCLIRAFPTQTLRRGIALNSSETTIINCYIAGFKSDIQDAQAINGWNGPGPFHIINNYLEGSGENLMFGGSTPNIPGLVPSNIEIKRNYLYKPLSWRQGEVGYGRVRWSVKNLFELKSARHVTFEGNELENCWGDVNPNYSAITLTASTDDSGPQATIEDVTIRYNVMKHTPNVFNILGNDAQNQSGLGLTIENNLFTDVDWVRWSNNPNDNSNYRGNFIKIGSMANVKVNHNTVFQSGNYISVYAIDSGFVFTNNIVNYSGGILGNNGTRDAAAITSYFPNANFSGNVIIGGNRFTMGTFTNQNYYPMTAANVSFVDYPNNDYRLSDNSLYKSVGTDGADPGADISSIQANSTPSIQLSSVTYSVSEGSTDAIITVTRTGDASASAAVGYATSDKAGLTSCDTVGTGIASSRCDYATTIGTLQFASGETSKTILVPIVDDAYAEGNESFNISLSNPTNNASLGLTSSATITIIDNDASNGTNPIDNTAFFVRQQYLDFLDRDADANWQAWQNIINNCPASGKDANGNYCDRIEVSSDFFRSPEFQDRGYFIYRFFKTLPSVTDPNNPQFGHIPLYDEFIPDFARVSGPLTADQLEANKVAFIYDFMTRGEFQTKYGTLTDPTAYVDALLQTVGLPNHPSRQTWINSLANYSMTRAQVLRALVESSEMNQKYYTEAFVMMEYFGYLRRSADASYVTWINTMNQNSGDYRTMINGFMNSSEYRKRFGN